MSSLCLGWLRSQGVAVDFDSIVLIYPKVISLPILEVSSLFNSQASLFALGRINHVPYNYYRPLFNVTRRNVEKVGVAWERG